MRVNYSTKSLKNSGFVVFLKTYWWLLALLLGISMLIPALIRFFKRQKVRDDIKNLENEQAVNDGENNQASPAIIAKKNAEIRRKYPNVTDSKLLEINTNAQRIAVALGTNVQDHYKGKFLGVSYEFFNGIFEDEDTVVKIAKIHTGTFPILEDYYYKIHTNSRNLKYDLLKYLSEKDLNQIRANHLKYGGFRHI